MRSRKQQEPEERARTTKARPARTSSTMRFVLIDEGRLVEARREDEPARPQIAHQDLPGQALEEGRGVLDAHAGQAAAKQVVTGSWPRRSSRATTIRIRPSRARPRPGQVGEGPDDPGLTTRWPTSAPLLADEADDPELEGSLVEDLAGELLRGPHRCRGSRRCRAGPRCPTGEGRRGASRRCSRGSGEGRSATMPRPKRTMGKA